MELEYWTPLGGSTKSAHASCVAAAVGTRHTIMGHIFLSMDIRQRNATGRVLLN
jgi:hypothetical protein